MSYNKYFHTLLTNARGVVGFWLLTTCLTPVTTVRAHISTSSVNRTRHLHKVGYHKYWQTCTKVQLIPSFQAVKTLEIKIILFSCNVCCTVWKDVIDVYYCFTNVDFIIIIDIYGTVVVVIVWSLELQLPITTNVVSSNPAHAMCAWYDIMW
jgi:hypothetical protein